VPRLGGWPYPRLDPDLRKAFEAALHAGSAAGLLPGARRTLPLGKHALLLAPAVAAGLAFERPIEQRLGSPRSIAVAQIVAGTALLVADLRPQRRRTLTTADAAAIGAAQATALIPGVSRSGAVVTAARALGFERTAAAALSSESAIAPLLGAGALKAWRLARNPPPPRVRAAVLAGALSAGVSTLAVRPLARRIRSYAPFALYRATLGAVALRHT
jgi:undecaprenyl-diphosphatase